MKLTRFCLNILIFLFSCTEVFSQTSSVSVTISGSVPNEVREATQYAADIWSQHLVSDVPIKINMLFVPFPGFLGISFPNAIMNFEGAAYVNTWYPTSLANAITGIEQNPGEFDMDIFISSVPNWYFGTDGNPAASQYDFISIFLHEIAHSLGFISLAKVENNLGSFGELELLDFGLAGLSFEFSDLGGLPSVFDRMLVNGSLQVVSDTMMFKNNSASLTAELIGDDLFLSGPSSSSALGGQMPKIYAPAAFQLGSSCTHLDESTYSGEDALMTPFSRAGEVHHFPGDLTLSILEDLGWEISLNSTLVISEMKESKLLVFPNPTYGGLNFSYSLERASNVDIRLYDVLGREIFVILEGRQQAGDHRVHQDLTDIRLSADLYIYRMVVNEVSHSGRFHLLKP